MLIASYFTSFLLINGYGMFLALEKGQQGLTKMVLKTNKELQRKCLIPCFFKNKYDLFLQTEGIISKSFFAKKFLKPKKKTYS